MAFVVTDFIKMEMLVCAFPKSQQTHKIMCPAADVLLCILT